MFYKLFGDAPIVALHNRYARGDALEYPPRVTRDRYKVYGPLDVASMGSWVGFNERGLYVAVTDQHSGNVEAAKKSRGKLVSHLLGSFSTAEEATAFLKEEIKKGYRKGNFILLDENRGFHVLYDGDVTTKELGRGIHVITNLTPLPGMEMPPQVREILERAEARKNRGLKLAEEIDTKDLERGLRGLQEIAADHGENPGRRSICYHDETGEWKMTSSTIVAVGRNLKDSQILYCRGNPCEGEFLDYSHLLKIEEGRGGEISRKSEKLAERKVALCLTGSVAAIETPKLARELRRHGAQVDCYMTDYAVKYGVSPEVMEWATGKEVVRELTGRVEHLYDYDLVLVYPATLNTIGKIAQGIADNAVTTLCAATEMDRLILMPAMNMRLYDSPVLQENIAKLRRMGVTVVSPRFSEGIAKIPKVEEVVDQAIRKLSRSRLRDRKILILAGPTRYDLDPIRFISNKASGRLGYWLAKEGFQRGCQVKVIYGPGEVQFPDYIPVINVYSTEDMLEESLRELGKDAYDVAIFSAAVLDFKPKERADFKVKSGEEWSLELVPTPKVIERVIGEHPDLFVVAFKLEYNLPEKELIEGAYERLKELKADLMVANDLTAIRGERHKAYIINKEKEVKLVDGTKAILAEEIFNAIEVLVTLRR
ncbi:MAG: bifunctional phosphopantothenoylcysteine decarboxylase/phosphopantothenate--cysteine ligase CoaBC [Candidatus Bathyarchaeia archaeon]